MRKSLGRPSRGEALGRPWRGEALRQSPPWHRAEKSGGGKLNDGPAVAPCREERRRKLDEEKNGVQRRDDADVLSSWG
nr:unnamed protein product [Digitaria exilis]